MNQKVTFLFATLLLLMSWSPLLAQSKFHVYISSDSPESAAGIVIYEFDVKTGALTNPQKVDGFRRSGYLNISPTGKYLYSVGTDDVAKESYLAAYTIIDRKTGHLKLLNKVIPEGRGACYVAVDNSGKHVLVANYSSGDILSYRLNEDGSIEDLADRVQHTETSIDPERQTAPHPHMILPAPENDIIVVPDLGGDKVFVYQLDTGTGKFEKAGGKGFGASPPGGGPRHFAFHPNNKFAYVLNELVGSVTAFKYKPKNGKLKPIHTVTTLPAGFKDYNKSADIHITPNGQYLYASNRGPNTIAALKIDQKSGELTFLGTFACGGEWPRAFGLDPTGKYIVVANKNTNNLAVFEIDYTTGLAEEVGRTEIPGPQCVKFLPWE